MNDEILIEAGAISETTFGPDGRDFELSEPLPKID